MNAITNRMKTIVPELKKLSEYFKTIASMPHKRAVLIAYIKPI